MAAVNILTVILCVRVCVCVCVAQRIREFTCVYN